jgi:hypothetical protein
VFITVGDAASSFSGHPAVSPAASRQNHSSTSAVPAVRLCSDACSTSSYAISAHRRLDPSRVGRSWGRR